MEAIAIGKNGARALCRAEEEDGLAAGYVITRPHSTVEKVARISDRRLKQRNVILMIAQVIVYFI